ncbi:MAG: hypothetical protein M5U34_03195 [Chloroflexi bacterium]|nr:hypothetical protein [Chloroflexota bacterium]
MNKIMRQTIPIGLIFILIFLAACGEDPADPCLHRLLWQKQTGEKQRSRKSPRWRNQPPPRPFPHRHAHRAISRHHKRPSSDAL